MSELVEKTDRVEKLPELLDGKDVAKLVEGICQETPLLSQHFAESNIVLTIAGLKPQTEFFVPLTKEKDIARYQQEVQKLNKYLQQHMPHIKFGLIGEPFISPSDKQLLQMINLENLQDMKE